MPTYKFHQYRSNKPFMSAAKERERNGPNPSQDELHRTWLSQDPTSSMTDMHPKNHRRAMRENATAAGIHLQNANRLGEDHPNYQAFIDLGNKYHDVAKWHHERMGEG